MSIGISRACNFPCTITLHIMSINWAKVGGARPPLEQSWGGAMAPLAPPIPTPLYGLKQDSPLHLYLLPSTPSPPRLPVSQAPPLRTGWEPRGLLPRQTSPSLPPPGLPAAPWGGGHAHCIPESAASSPQTYHSDESETCYTRGRTITYT